MRAKILRLNTLGGNRTHDLSLNAQRARRKGLDDIHKPVRLDVMDFPDGRKLKYFQGPFACEFASRIWTWWVLVRRLLSWLRIIQILVLQNLFIQKLLVIKVPNF